MIKKKSSLTREALLEYLSAQGASNVSRREIARAFGIKGQDRITLKALLKQLWQDGSLIKKGKSYAIESTPEFSSFEIISIESDGEFKARPLTKSPELEHASVSLFIVSGRGPRGASAKIRVGDRVLARIYKIHDTVFHGHIFRKLEETLSKTIGVYEERPGKGGMVIPTDRQDKNRYLIDKLYTFNAHEGDLVEVELIPSPNRALPKGRIIRIIGSIKKPKSFSLIAIHTYDLPYKFSKDALDLAEKATIPQLKGREDLRNIPLVTIDDEDARDFDDAVFAEKDLDPKNPDGWHLIVAIADVSYYVHEEDQLDKEAYERGNSVYFPDSVIPMLPEELSNGLCSLKPEEDRACLAVHLWINSKGQLIRHKFVRGLMRSYARLTYKLTQRAYDGDETALPKDIVEQIVKPLYAAYFCLEKAREHRAPLELNVPERQVLINNNGAVEKIIMRPRLTSHRLIEDYMILANVAAATTLEQKGFLAMYRVHDSPTLEKIEALREFLKGTSFALPKGSVILPKTFNYMLEKASLTPMDTMINTLVLRTQAQAIYSPKNIGHFGLNLRSYCHFTSPIRRYADLLVHRALIKSLKLDKEAKFSYTMKQFEAIAEHISFTERQAAEAERSTSERYLSAYLSEKIGQVFEGVISGVTNFALFVSLKENGADCFLPLRKLPDDYYVFDESNHRLVGRRYKKIFTLGDSVKVLLEETNPLTGQILVSMAPYQKSTEMKDTKRSFQRPKSKKAPKRRPKKS